MKLFVGLGNPTKEYENTRHNIGFMFLDYLCGKKEFIVNKKFNAMECEKTIGGEKILFIKPLSYMNCSGEVVIRYINYYKIDIDDIIVVQDDLDMPVGKYKLMFNHGDGGHNGIKNIILNINDKKFLRLKIGISKNSLMDTKDYVLGKFSKEELNKIIITFDDFKDFVNDYVSMNRDLLIGKYNTKNKIQEG